MKSPFPPPAPQASSRSPQRQELSPTIHIPLQRYVTPFLLKHTHARGGSTVYIALCASSFSLRGFGDNARAGILHLRSLSVAEGRPGHCGVMSGIPDPTHSIPGAPPHPSTTHISLYYQISLGELPFSPYPRTTALEHTPRVSLIFAMGWWCSSHLLGAG